VGLADHHTVAFNVAVTHAVKTTRHLHHGRGRHRPGPGLSSRQIDILRLIAAGNSSSQIATRMNLSVHTVKSHIVRAGQRLGTSSRAEMVLVALRARIIT
jgi:DNA-binding NarL/FixJ family response regulator